MMKKWLFLFVLLNALWLLFTWSLKPADLIAGAIVSLIISSVLRDVFNDDMVKLLHPVRVFWGILYIPIFFYHMIIANFDVAYRVLNPGLPINPGIVKVKTNLKTDMGKALLANSITLTPGTLTVDIDKEYLYIHWINVLTVDEEKASKEIVDKFEKYIVRIFG
jgi:multicomponent Na+:H+ antiporter subunit E